MKLIIAEKPSLARTVAKVIGIVKEHKAEGYIECANGYYMTWVFGHIVENAAPADYDIKYKSFNMANLPIIPTTWKLLAKESSKTQYNNIKKLLKSATTVINCGDPDREGQLLVDELLIHFGCKLPVLRLLILDPKDAAIKKAVANMEDNTKYFSWYQAGLLRSQADWLIGMNFTPAFSILGYHLGIINKGVISMGRVQTPTLKLIYDRALSIENYKPLSFYNLQATFNTKDNKSFSAKLDFNGLNFALDAEGRLLDKKLLDSIKTAINGKTGTIAKYEVKDCETGQPSLFKLSDLQALANSKLGLSADDTLKIAQSLYEKQLTTYPRTGCSYLPESLHADAGYILKQLAPLYGNEIARSDASIKSRAFNDKQLGGESHFAIIPTGDTKALVSLKPEELKLYKLIAMQYIAQFYPPMTYQQTTGTVTCQNYNFNFSGKVTKSLGWKALFSSAEDNQDEDKSNDEDAQVLPPLNLNESVTHTSDEIKKSTTTKPKFYTEGTLIKAMANIHSELANIVDTYYPDKQQANEMVEKYKKVLKDTAGLGTEATRSNTIAKLKEREYIVLDKKNIAITEKGKAVMALLTNDQNLIEFSMLTSPLTTAIYEQQLEQVLNGQFTAKQFNTNLHNLITDKLKIVSNILAQSTPVNPTKTAATSTGEKCPECQSDIVERDGKFGKYQSCSNYPKCTWKPAKKTEPSTAKPTGNKCPQCKHDLVMKAGKFGDFEACGNYPSCKYITPKAEKPPAEKSGDKCPKCNNDMLKKKSKDGTKTFLGCAGFPECNHVEW